MKLRGKIVVEPLDDDRVTHIERRIVAGAAEAAARGRQRAFVRGHASRVLVAAALVAAGAVGWLVHRAPASPGVALEPAAIHVDHGALDLGDARIASDARAHFTVTRPAGGVLVALDRGKVELDVDKRGARPPLVVRAGDTDVIVVGTHFTVDYGDGHGEVEVRVREGVVRVVRHSTPNHAEPDAETRVAAGQAWQTHGGLRTEATTAGNGDPAPMLADAGHADAAPPALGHAPDVLHDRTPAVPAPASVPRPVPARPAAASERPLGQDALRPRPAGASKDPRVDLFTAIRAQRVVPALDVGEPDAAKAVAKYYAIAAHTSGDDASAAFYSVAVVRHARLGRNADALQALDAYVRRFPAGAEYRAALWLRVRILCFDHIDDRCRAAAYTYLHEAPDDPAAHVAELITLSDP